MAIPQVLKDLLAHTPAQLRRQHTSHQACKVQTSMGHQAGNINHMANTQAAASLKPTLVAPNTARLGKTCQGRPRTDRATLVHRISRIPLYPVANTIHPFQAHQAHNQISLSPARPAPSTIQRSLVLQPPNTTNPTPAPRAVPRTRPFLPSKVTNMARRFLVHQAVNPTPLYPALPAVNILKPFPDHQATNTALRTRQVLPTRQRWGPKPPRLMVRKLPPRMDSRRRLPMGYHLQQPMAPNPHWLAGNTINPIHLNLTVHRTANTHNQVSKASILLNRSRTPRCRARQLATTPMPPLRRWALIPACKVPIRASTVGKWASQV